MGEDEKEWRVGQKDSSSTKTLPREAFCPLETRRKEERLMKKGEDDKMTRARGTEDPL